MKLFLARRTVIVLVFLLVSGCGLLVTDRTLVPASTPPVLPEYQTVTPTTTTIPTKTPEATTTMRSKAMQPGEAVTVTNGDGMYAWIQYLGIGQDGYDKWICVTNNPQKVDCVHRNFGSVGLEIDFLWYPLLENSASFAWTTDSQGGLKLADGWYFTILPETP